MYLPLALPLLLFAQAAPAARAFEPHRSLARATEQFHRYAKRHSARFARDLRVVFQGLSVEQADSDPNASRQVYCVRPDDLSAGLKGNGSSTSPATNRPGSTGTASGATPTATSAYKLVESHSGKNFFDRFSFWDIADPTDGTVDYQSQSNAESDGLININDAGNAVMRVDTTSTISGNRKSVRITTENTFTQGIFVLDAVHMPQGCGTWPAFWSNGPDWPTFGEIDIMEGVNDYTNNQATVHTAPGCTIPSNSTPQSLDIAATLVGVTNCAAAETSNQGCGMRSNSNTTYGSGFNSISGGVYAMVWDDDQIAVYFFPRGSIPQDLLAEAPLPDTWGTPMARWPSSSCDMAKFFKNHSIIINTTLCGQWAGSVWGSTGVPGQESSCATRTGYSTCEDFVRNSGASFGQAYWEISSMKVYQTSRQS
ncbi:glycoside hydrolase family 16 protein [Fomitiporia mediterranea MF3/22]|uniref:glycoside hydrolase family 16 protein n=1 Tax=Fomitiporia mediterranea (strain MF3/22) TaxID=694068 RepID=UPI0004409725|nr:glycoside hydrolase family 16 protein [Fomitiporia mediterranea MF3/22]EJD03859.1 glycoside hydrolase family 16 protein [Fomitiporia mediterranea MF3/22]